MDVDITQYLRNPLIDLDKNYFRLLSSIHPKKCFNIRRLSSNTFHLEMKTKKKSQYKKNNNKSLHELDMKDINNLDITITKGALFSENILKKTYTTVNGLKNLITASSTYLIGESSSHKS